VQALRGPPIRRTTPLDGSFDAEPADHLSACVAPLPDGITVSRKRVAILISGRGSNMEALIAAAAQESYPAQIAVVVSNRPDAPGLGRAAMAGIATEIVDHGLYPNDREGFERLLQAKLEAHRIDVVCLAGFMRLLSPGFVGKWQGRMLNIHPALLPAFKGLDTHARALAAGVKIHGTTVHMVVPEVDSGPILAQAAVPVREDDTADTLAARVLEAEHRIYPAALKLLAEGRVRVIDGRCRIDGKSDADGPLFVPNI
jgi:phosphoribosylglycinamide formyltransferase-1